MKQVVQTLQLALEKEKTKVHGLKEQVGALERSMFSFKLKSQLHVFFNLPFKLFQRVCHSNIYFDIICLAQAKVGRLFKKILNLESGIVVCMYCNSSSYSEALGSPGCFHCTDVMCVLGGSCKG